MATIYRTHRPQAWAAVAGQEHVKAVLMHQLVRGTGVHAYLFSGPRGVGKTTVARIFARALNCTARGESPEPCGTCPQCAASLVGESLDIVEMDAASHRGIDAVRDDIIEHSRFAPARSKYKVYIVDEVHMMTTEAFNALLKTLEEPPSHAVFVLATTDAHKVPETVLSRCQRFDFSRIGEEQMVARLSAIADKEGKGADEAALRDIARRAEGGLRDAEGMLGKALAISGGQRVTLETLAGAFGAPGAAHAEAYVAAVLRQDAGAALAAVAAATEAGADATRLTAEAVELLRTRLHAAVAPGSAKGVAAAVFHALDAILDKQRLLRGVQPAELVLELAAVAACGDFEAAAAQGGSAAASKGGAAAGERKPAAAMATMATTGETVPAAKAPETPVAHAASAAASKEPVAPVAAVSADIEAVRAKWQGVLGRVGENNPSLTYLLGGADLIAVEDGALTIGVQFSFHRDKLLEEKNRSAVEEAIFAETGAKLGVACALLEKKEEIGDTHLAHAAAPAMAADPLVAAFGGRVVE